jgi:16S rRNA (guanine527-N7)-methyltransferase
VAPRDLRTRLARRASKAGVFIDVELSDRLLAFYELLSRWNRKINLTALDEPDAAIDRLLLEPVVAARHVPVTASALMDIGSGGGSPAIPLKLAVPRLALTMVEVKARKSAFLREAIRHLQLENATVETSRYEELLARPELHESFDVLSLRAVRVESEALTTLQAFVKPGGVLFLFRGPGGPDAPDLLPPLEWSSTLPLVETLQSRLTVVSKVQVGGAAFPRGTVRRSR